MNAREKSIVGLTLNEIAQQATEMIRKRISEDLPGNLEIQRPWSVNEIIVKTLDEFIPKKTLKDRGVRVRLRIDGHASFKSIVQEIDIEYVLRRSHPFFSYGFDSKDMHSITNIFEVKRQRDGKSLRFKELSPAYKSTYGKKTVLKHCESNMAHLVSHQQHIWDAARTLLEFREIHGEDQLRTLIQAVNKIQKLPAYRYTPETGYGFVDWSVKENLLDVSGMAHRTRAILNAIQNGKHAKAMCVDPEKLGFNDLPAQPKKPELGSMVHSVTAAEDGGWEVDGSLGKRHYYRYSINDAVNLYIAECER